MSYDISLLYLELPECCDHSARLVVGRWQTGYCRKAYQQVARLDQRVSNQRSDYLWKVANRLNQAAEYIIFEDLNIMGMVRRCKPKQDESGKFLVNGQAAKAGLNKAILDAAWGELKLKTVAVAAKSGHLVWSTNPRKSS